jgi:hypothetical protein
MAYFHEGDGYSGPSSLGCGSRCACATCQQKREGLSEYYYEGEGRDPPRLKGYGFAGYGETPASGEVTRDMKIVVKSYVAPIGWHAGSPYCGGLLNPTADLKLRALALATDAAMSENPTTDAKDKRYRLYSARTFTVKCKGGTIVSVVPTPIDSDTGHECVPRTSACLQPPALIVYGVTAGLTSPTTFQFSWTAKGRPHGAAEPGFQVVCPRTSVYIWHKVTGRIECSGGEPRVDLTLVGSRFPSHRVFVNGVPRLPTIAQGTFSNLWVPAGISEPTLVR